MSALPRLLFALALVVAPAMIWGTSAQLPATVASHFGGGGPPNGWMSHDGYLAFMLGLVTLLPLVVVAAVGWMPSVAPSRIQLPNRDHWLAPQQRAQTLAALRTYACWLGILLIVFMTALHMLLIEANAATPPRLPEAPFLTMLAAFVVALAFWILTLLLRFRLPAQR